VTRVLSALLVVALVALCIGGCRAQSDEDATRDTTGSLPHETTTTAGEPEAPPSEPPAEAAEETVPPDAESILLELETIKRELDALELPSDGDFDLIDEALD
jgi:hypothetical protein